MNRRGMSMTPSSTTNPVGKTAPNGGLTPTPVCDIVPKTPSVTNTSQNNKMRYDVDESGVLNIHTYPTCNEIMYMLPFPFFCLGCFSAKSAIVEFNDNTSMVKIRQCYGFLCCCSSTIYRPYCDIGNIACQKVKQIRGQDPGVEVIHIYRAVILWNDGSTTVLSPPDYFPQVAKEALAFHLFVFGRNNPYYNAPQAHELEIP